MLFSNKKNMLKIYIRLICVGFLLSSCKEDNKASNVEQTEKNNAIKIGIVSNLDGAIIYSETDSLSRKIEYLKYATKINVLGYDKSKKRVKIKYKNKEVYLSKDDIEIISAEVYKKSYFTKDCYCILGLDRIQAINFPTQYDTIKYFFKDNKIRLIKESTYCRPPYDSYKENEYDVKKNIENLGYLEVNYTINKNTFFDGDLFFEEKKTYLSCYSKKSVFDVTDKEVKLSKFYSVEEFNYAINLFNIDLLFVKADILDFVKPMTNFDFTTTELLIEQDKMHININTRIKLYRIDNYKNISYNLNYISFNYLREIKIIKKDGKKRYFAKINVLESEDSNISGEYYIDLKEVANFASIPD